MQNRFFKSVLLAVAASAGLAGARAHAALSPLQITLSEPSNPSVLPVTYTDTSNSGKITNVINFGDFTIFNLEAATSNKTLTPTPTQAVLEITAIVESTSGASAANPQTLVITTSDFGYLFPGSTGNTMYMDSSMSGTLAPATAGDLVNFQSTATPISGGTTITPGLQQYVSTGLNAGTYSVADPDANDTWSRGSSFDLSNTVTLSFHSAGEEANVSGTTTAAAVKTIVPEPASGLLMMVGASVLALGRKRRII